jgi:hypothetical protein
MYITNNPDSYITKVISPEITSDGQINIGISGGSARKVIFFDGSTLEPVELDLNAKGTIR